MLLHCYISVICECVQFLSEVDASVVSCGDFNFPSIVWNSADYTIANVNLFHTGTSNTRVTEFANFVVLNSLKKFVVDSTRDNNILDLVLSNDQFAIMDTCVTQPFSSSDHNTVVFGLLNDISCSDFKRVYNYSTADWAWDKSSKTLEKLISKLGIIF